MSHRTLRPGEVDRAVSQLVGLPCPGSGRAADMETFDFGTLIEATDRRGRPTVRASFSLHVQAPWRIVLDDRIVVGYRDLRDPPAGVPADGWDPNTARVTRRDELLLGFLDRPTSLRVVAASAARTGDLRLTFDDGAILEVVPDSAALDDEHWRLIRPDGSHVVVSGDGAILVAPAPGRPGVGR